MRLSHKITRIEIRRSWQNGAKRQNSKIKYDQTVMGRASRSNLASMSDCILNNSSIVICKCSFIIMKRKKMNKFHGAKESKKKSIER